MKIVESLLTFLQGHILQAKSRNQNIVIRPILVGPPPDILSGLFDSLTNNGTTNWKIESLEEQVVVLYILGSKEIRHPPPASSVLSRECQWDYAVSVRNSYPIVVMLVDPSAWDNCPESLVNTTEVLGLLKPSGSNGWSSNPLWKNVLRQIRDNLGVDYAKAKDALSRLVKESNALDVSTKMSFLWRVANDLLSSFPSELEPDNALAFGVGFPRLDGLSKTKTIADSHRVVKHLGDFVKKHGLTDGFEKLKNTPTAANSNLIPHLDELQSHINSKSISGIGFSYSPIWFYRPQQPIPSWWNELSVSVIETLLEESGEKPQTQLNLLCENALNKQSRLHKEPVLVLAEAHLRATAPDGGQVSNSTFQRKIASALDNLVATPYDDSACVDATVPIHEKPIRYLVNAQNFRPGMTEVIVLSSFACLGHVRVKDAESNPPPTKEKKTNSWKQDIILSRGGVTDIDLLCSPLVKSVKLEGITLQAPIEQEVLSPNRPTTFVIPIESETSFTVFLYNSTGDELNRWTVRFTIEEVTEAVSTRFDALMRVHIDGGRLPVASMADSILLRLEGTYLESEQSWKPVVACWARDIDMPTSSIWNTNPPFWGNTQPTQQGLPPVITAPLGFVQSRELVRRYLQSKKRPIEEIELDDLTLVDLVNNYIQVFFDWLSSDPDHACWTDTIAIYAATKNMQAGGYSTSDEPVSLVLSPLHPLKIGWQVLAQQQLSESLNNRCPAAGLLTPNTCPDIGGWTLILPGQKVTVRSYFAVPCTNRYWSVLQNRGYLSQTEEQKSVLDKLAEIGLETRSITGGFSQSQAMHSIQEISRLLPGRSTLRIVIIGNSDTSTELSDGVVDWCKYQLGDENKGVGPLNVEILDTRNSVQPSPGALAVLSDETHERARWFRVDDLPPDSRLDLVILDHLGSGSPSANKGERRSVVGGGSLYRTRIRQDFNNAVSVSETRIGRPSNYLGGLSGTLQETVIAFEELSLKDERTSHFQLRPNQQAIGRRLAQSTYLAITSSQLDPGGIIRGVTGQEGYLWDYELPGMLGGDEESAGFYLLAKPLASMKDAIANSASLVTSSRLSDSSIQNIIQEISRRGIPVLKRLASGGSQSRGELGMLLATRLLQNVFAPSGQEDGLPVWSGDCVHMILPVDPYEEPFEKIRVALTTAGTSAKRPDLLVIAIKLSSDGSPLMLKITPVEVKFRGDSSMSLSQLKEALSQASNLGKVLDSVWCQQPVNQLWDTCGRALLTECLDFAFRIYASEDVHQHSQDDWTAIHELVLDSVLNGQTSITVTTQGRLIVFDTSNQTTVIDVDNDLLNDAVVVNLNDARDLLLGDFAKTGNSKKIISALGLAFPSCSLGTQEGDEVSVFQSAESTVIPVPSENTEISDTTSSDSQDYSSDEHPVFPEPKATIVNTLIPDSIRQQVSHAFDEFIGNESAVKLIKNDLLRALIDNPPHLAKNFLFTGEPSTGKTELARRLASALNLPFVKLDGRGLGSRERLFELVNGELSQKGLSPAQFGQQSGLPVLVYPPLIVFVDEVHLVPKIVQESLLTLLEAVDRTVTMKSFVAKMTQTTFLFATTRPSEIDKAFRSRCSEIALKEYSVEQVAEMLKLRFPPGWPDSVYQDLARLGRRVPRVAIELAKDLETAITVSENQNASVQEHLEDVRKTHEIDNLGLKPLDYQYLKVLEEEGKPVGEQSIINLISTADKDRITDEVEPFLRKLGFIRLGSRGREITEKGLRYIFDAKKDAGKI